MPTRKAAPKKSAAKKPVAPKLPPITFNEVYLRGSAFTTQYKQCIANFMAAKHEKQATTAAMRMIQEYWNQSRTIEALIKDKNELMQKLEDANTHLRLLHTEVATVNKLEADYLNRKGNLVALVADIGKLLPAVKVEDPDEWDPDFDEDDYR